MVARICNVFRHHFKFVDFVVPNYAYSAGTVLVLSGDSIYMDYYSVLGPIDPQQVNSNGRLIPLMGYLHEYNELISKSKTEGLTDAELYFLSKRFDPAEMFFIKQARDHSIELIKKWLVKYKFKNWKRTRTKNQQVTMKMKRERAEYIASILGDATRWHSHGRGITMQELQSKEIQLMIDDYGKDKELNEVIHRYYDLFQDYCQKFGVILAFHSANGFKHLG